jgi:hypothetical protein
MTEAEAHKFVARWNGFILPRRVRTEDETIREVGRRLLLVVFLAFILTSCSVYVCILISQISGHMLVSVVFNFSIFSFSIWQTLRLRQARRALDQSQISNG